MTVGVAVSGVTQDSGSSQGSVVGLEVSVGAFGVSDGVGVSVGVSGVGVLKHSWPFHSPTSQAGVLVLVGVNVSVAVEVSVDDGVGVLLGVGVFVRVGVFVDVAVGCVTLWKLAWEMS
jgi:hypothetical protein